MSEIIDIKFVTNAPEYATESKRIEQAITGVERKSKEATEDMSQNIKIQTNVLKDLEKQYKELEKAIKKMPVSDAKSSKQAQMAGIKKELHAERQALVLLTEEQKKYEASTVSLRTQIMNKRNAMATMTEGTREYIIAMRELGELQDRMGDIQAQGRVFADDEKNTRATMETIQGLTGAMSVGMGVAALFGASQENLAKIQTRLQAVMSISVGVNQVAQVLNKDSYFTHIVLAKAKAVDATVTGVLSGAMAKLGLTTAAANVAARGLMITVTGGLIIGAWALVAVIDKINGKRDEERRKIEELAQANKDYASSVAGNAAGQITAFQSLKAEFNSLGDNIKAKEKFVKDNQKAFDDLGVAIDDVSEAENLFKTNAPEFVEAIMLRAKAAAYAALQVDKMKEAIIRQQEANTREIKPTEEDLKKIGWSGLKTVTYNLLSNIGFNDEANKVLAKYTMAATQVARQRAVVDGKIAEEDIKRIGELSQKEAEALKSAAEKLAIANINPNKKTVSSSANPNNETPDDTPQLLRDVRNRQFEIAQAEIDAMAEGSDKKIAQLELDHEREKAKLEEQADQTLKIINSIRKARGEKELEKLPDNVASDFGVLKGAAGNKLTAGIANVTKSDIDQIMAQMQAEDEAYTDHLLKYGDYYDKKYAIAKSYSDKIAAVTTEGEKLTLGKEQQQAELDLDTSQMKLSESWSQVFRDLEGMSRAEVKVLIGEINEQLENEELAPANASALLEQMNKAKDFAIALNPFASLIEGLGAVKTATEELEAAKIALQKVTDNGGSDTERKAAEEAKKRAQEKVNRTKEERNASASQSLSDISSVAGATSDLLKTFGVESPAVDGVVNALSSLAEIDFGNPISIITGGLKAVASLLGGIFKQSDKRKEREIQRIQEQVDALDKSYEKLGEEVDKAYSTDAAKLIAQQDEMLKKQNELIEQQKREEQSKKDPNDGSIDDYNNVIDENNKKLEENKQKKLDAINGTDVKSAIDDFANAYVDAWASGEDKAASMKDVVKRMVKSAVTELMKSRLSPEVNKFMEFLATAMEDGILTDVESKMLDQFETELYNKAEGIDKSFDKYIKDDTAKNESSLTGQIRGSVATEASVSELGGIFRGQLEKLSSIDSRLDLGFKSIAEMARLQAEIAVNTRRTADNTDGLGLRIDATNKKLDTVIKNTQKEYGKL